MEFFKRAKVFRLKCGHHNKYLDADKDDETVRQSSNPSSINVHWAIEPVEGKSNVVRFRSCHTYKYLATTDETFLTGMTGKKLAQRLRLDSTVEWEPVKEGQYIKLKSQAGTLLRANSGLPPWRNSVTHDVPGHWSGTENMVLWIVDIVELDYNSNRGTKDDNELNSGSNVKDAIDVQSSSSMKKSNSESKLNPGQTVLEDEFRRLPSVENMSGLAVNVAKKTFKEPKYVEFHTVLSSGQIKKLEKTVNVITADAKISGSGNDDLTNLDERLKDLEKDYKEASEELVEFTTFSSRRYEIKAELKKDVAKARELEAIEAELKSTLIAAKAMRDELLKQLEETENSVKGAEKSHADGKVEIEELTSIIKEKSEAFEVMERENKTWQERKYEAERTLERVEEDWLQVKNMMADFW